MLFKTKYTKNYLYNNVLIIIDKMKRIQSKLQKVKTYENYKISLSGLDDKNYILDDGINSLAYFHKDILRK